MALLRALLLATWHDLSDVKLAEALDDGASFRRFRGFAAHEPTPERTAFVRFRRELVRRGLDRVLFEAVTRQLEAKGVMVRTGTLVDATLIPSASIRGDGEARWAGTEGNAHRAVHRRRAPTHGDKAQVATDRAAVLLRSVEVTTATVHDAAQVEAVLRQSPARSAAIVPLPAARPSVPSSRVAARRRSCIPARGARRRRWHGSKSVEVSA